ncbi:hypothetical protein GCM10028774_24870 [Spirosoma jeollabukense]
MAQLSYAQATFEYDAAGNRVKRTGSPDLSILLNVSPTTTYGTTNLTARISVFNLSQVPTVGTITVYLSKDPLVNFTFDPTATFVGTGLVQNANWSFDNSNPNFWILTSSIVIAGGNSSRVGLSGVITPGNTRGLLSLTALVSSVGDTVASNNAASTSVQYFEK